MPTTITATSLHEAIVLLSQYGKNCKIIAGGTDVLPKMKKGETLPEVLLNIRDIRDLDYIEIDENGILRIGALTSINTIAESALINSKYSVLAQAAGALGTPVIRRQATIGGNLCNAAPSAETAPALIVLNSSLKIAGMNGEKILPVTEFFIGPGTTCLKSGDMLMEIQVPRLPCHCGLAYIKQSRIKGADVATASAAVLVVMEGNVVRDVKISLGAVAPTPIRAYRAEDLLKGKKWIEGLSEQAGQAVARESSPIDDIRGSAGYRRKLAAVLVKRVLEKAIERVKTEK